MIRSVDGGKLELPVLCVVLNDNTSQLWACESFR